MPRMPVKGSLSALLLFSLGCTFCGSELTPAAAPLLQVEAPCAAQHERNSAGACVPDAWYCGPRFFDGGGVDGCDCDCGVPDPDCSLSGVAFWCYNGGRPLSVAACDACPAPRRAH